MRFSRFLLVGLLGFAACVDQPTAPDGRDPSLLAADLAGHSGEIRVMSQNMYLGANIDLLLAAQGAGDVNEVFHQLGISTLSGALLTPPGTYVPFWRARRMAQQIALANPHLVGLQEVTRYTMGGTTLDFLTMLQFWLGVYGANYTAYRHSLALVDFPAMFGNPAVTYNDGDAILVRSDVEVIGTPVTKAYDVFEHFSVAGVTFDNRRGYMAVTAEIDGQQVRFVNTHLEVQAFEDTQLEQTAELIEAFQDETMPVMMVGDYNSAANHDAPADQMSGSYRMLRNAGFADIWLRTPHSVAGYTCCQNAYLNNTTSQLSQRLDLVWARWGKAGFGGQSTMDIVGEDVADRISFTDPALGNMALTLWPSDHAAVVARLWPAPGLANRK